MQTPEYLIKRRGFKTSEFAITGVALLLPFVQHVAKLLPPESWPAQIIAGLVAAAYVVSRGQIKASRNEASALVAAAIESTLKIQSVPAVLGTPAEHPVEPPFDVPLQTQTNGENASPSNTLASLTEEVNYATAG